MIDISPEMSTVIMMGGLLLLILGGCHLSIALGITALAGGYLFFGETVIPLIVAQMFALSKNYVLLAFPLFIFMGYILQASGIADKMYDALYLWLGGIKGGLAIITVLVGAVLAACVGIMGASVSMLTILAIPAMIRRGYDRSLATGAVCAGGTLGILIPPSVMLVVYGPMAQVSVGKLFMGAMFPGLLLAFLYVIYILIRCLIQPKLAPAIPSIERKVSFRKKVTLLLVSVVPAAFIILSVLGTIFFGIAPPTEAAAVGCIAALVLVGASRKLNWQVMKEMLIGSLKITSMGMFIGIASMAFTAVFLNAGCGDVVQNAVMSAPFGRWGAFAVIMFIYFILGSFIEWIGILFIMVPIMAPLAPMLGFDPLWLGLMICINLQMSFMTPPYAFALFVVKGVAPPELGITTGHLIRGVIPHILLVAIGLGLCIAFPQIILWLPAQMIR